MMIYHKNLSGKARDLSKLAKWMAGDSINYRKTAVSPQKSTLISIFLRFLLIFFY